MLKRKKKSWSFIAGERGVNRVRAFAHNETGRLFLEYHELDGVTGKRRKVRVALSHQTTEEAKTAAETLAGRLRNFAPVHDKELTVGSLFDNYEREQTPVKTSSTQSHDKRTLPMFRQFFGPHRSVMALDYRDWDGFIRERRKGQIRPISPASKSSRTKYVRPTTGVRNRIIQQDLKLLQAVLNWATRLRKPSGEPILARNPFAGFQTPVEQSPNRPMLSRDDLAAMEKVAASVNQSFPLLLKAAYLSGHRISAILKLRWSDIDLETSQIHWRGENDKIGYDHTVPMDQDLASSLRTTRLGQCAIGEAYVFPSPSDPSQPLPRLLARDWWERAEKLAGITHQKGKGWHSLRRLFASELRHSTPAKDLCALGGWKNYQTVLICYQQADEATMRKALENRDKPRLADAI
jgi:integrase